MRRSILGLAVLVSLALPVLVLAQNEAPACVAIRHEARYGADGYNHVVIVQNGCPRRVQCRIATNVNPQETRVAVPAGETTETVTFLGSPAREFAPRVSCEQDR